MTGELFFVIRYDGVVQRIHHVAVAETTIGREPDSVLRLPDPDVSRNHAVLIRTANEFRIRDLRSRNGTRLNGERIQDAVLSEAALLEICDYELKACGDLDSAQADAAGSEGSTHDPRMPRAISQDQERREQLTPAQRRVYYELLHGHTEKEVAHLLQISIHTVHTHSRAIYTAFEVSSRGELLALCAGHLTRPGFRP